MDTCKHLVENLGFDVDSLAADGSGKCFHKVLRINAFMF